MDKDKLSPREQALLDAARRDVAPRASAAPAASIPQAPAKAHAAPSAKPAPTAAERLTQLMAEERAESQEKKKKMRRRGLAISAGIVALFALWVLRASRRR